MCLVNAKKSKVKTDVKAYKVLRLVSDYKLHSPYYYYFWGTRDRMDDIQHSGTDVPVAFGGRKTIYGDSFHTFESFKHAEMEAEDISNNRPGCLFCVVECTIPAETKYLYEGEYGFNKAYASESLRLDKIISKYQNGHIVDIEDKEFYYKEK